jgi:hypothetical protein
MCMRLIFTVVFLCLISVSGLAGFLDSLTGTQSAVSSSVQGAVNSTTASSSVGIGSVSRKTTSVFGYDKNEVLDYSTQGIGSLDIKPLQVGLQFKTKLTVEQYQILIKDWLNNAYDNKFDSKAWVLKYFVRALAEFIFSNKGYLSTTDFNTVLSGFENYRQIDSCITKLELSSPIKYSLAKLFAAGCVYTRFIDKNFILKAMDIIKKIPKDCVLYHMEEQSEELMQEGKIADVGSDTMLSPDNKSSNQNLTRDQLGNFVGYEHGENLYYICMSHYNNFKDLPLDKQIKIINQIYSYNPTLMEAHPIKRKRYCWDYFMDYFYPKKNPEVMKYCIRAYVNWVLLPPESI